jgi:hypothetical protein
MYIRYQPPELVPTAPLSRKRERGWGITNDLLRFLQLSQMASSSTRGCEMNDQHFQLHPMQCPLVIAPEI